VQLKRGLVTWVFGGGARLNAPRSRFMLNEKHSTHATSCACIAAAPEVSDVIEREGASQDAGSKQRGEEAVGCLMLSLLVCLLASRTKYDELSDERGARVVAVQHRLVLIRLPPRHLNGIAHAHEQAGTNAAQRGARLRLRLTTPFRGRTSGSRRA